VWLRHPTLSSRKDLLLARVTDSAILAGVHRSSTTSASTASYAGASNKRGEEQGGEQEGSSSEGPANVYGEGYRGARVMAKGGDWRRFDFGLGIYAHARMHPSLRAQMLFSGITFIFQNNCFGDFLMRFFYY